MQAIEKASPGNAAPEKPVRASRPANAICGKKRSGDTLEFSQEARPAPTMLLSKVHDKLTAAHELATTPASKEILDVQLKNCRMMMADGKATRSADIVNTFDNLVIGSLSRPF